MIQAYNTRYIPVTKFNLNKKSKGFPAFEYQAGVRQGIIGMALMAPAGGGERGCERY